MKTRSETAVKLILGGIVALWAWGWVPSMAVALTVGRQVSEVLSDTAPVAVPLATSLTKWIASLGVVVFLIAIALSVNTSPAAKPRVLGALILPWISIYVIHDIFLNESNISTSQYILPLFFVAIFYARPTTEEICRLLARLTLITACASLWLGAMWEEGLMPKGWHADEDKALIMNTVLAGAYSHSNRLGLVLALGIPFVLLTYSTGIKMYASLLVISGALIWSASRVSIVVSIAVILAILLVARGVVQDSRRLLTWLLAGGLTAMAALPLLTKNPEAFTNRGLIWRESRRLIRDSPWLGSGSDVFQVDNTLSLAVGARPVTAHNIMLTLATIGGAVTLTASVVMLIVIIVRCYQNYVEDIRPMFFLLTLVMLGVAEDPLRAFRLGPQSFIVWAGLALVLCEFRNVSQAGAQTPSRRKLSHFLLGSST